MGYPNSTAFLFQCSVAAELLQLFLPRAGLGAGPLGAGARLLAGAGGQCLKYYRNAFSISA